MIFWLGLQQKSTALGGSGSETLNFSDIGTGGGLIGVGGDFNKKKQKKNTIIYRYIQNIGFITVLLREMSTKLNLDAWYMCFRSSRR